MDTQRHRFQGLDASASETTGTASPSVASDLDQVAVVDEEQDLGRPGELAEDLKAGGRPFVVEVDEEVVGHKRHGRRPIEVLGHRGDP